MEKMLFNIELAGMSFTKEEVETLNSFEPNLNIRERDRSYFELSTYSTGYTKPEDNENYKAMNDKVRDVNYAEYKDIPDNIRKDMTYDSTYIPAVDIELFAEKINVPFKVLSRTLITLSIIMPEKKMFIWGRRSKK